MTFLAPEVTQMFLTFLWPMLRISALLMTAPPFSTSAFTVRLRILFAVVLTWMVYPLHSWPVLDPLSAVGLAEIFNQIFIGVTMGLILQIAVAAVVVGGQAISGAMGLAMANMIDPNVGNVPVLSSFLLILSTLIFIGFGGHAILLGLVLESFDAIPIGVSILNKETHAVVIRWSSMMFLGALLLSLPVLVSLLFVNIGLGVVTRAAPSLNIFALGFPALIIAGMLILMLSLDGIAGRIEWLWMQGFVTLRSVLGVAHG